MKAPIRLSVLAVLSLSLQAQVPATPQTPAVSPPPAMGVIVGQTVDGTSGRPVAGALVALTAAPGGLGSLTPGDAIPMDQLMSLDIGSLLSGTRQAITDGQGRFAFTGLPAATFSLAATKPGWSGGGYGQRRPDGAVVPLLLNASNRTATVALQMWKNAALTGSVTDEAGDPIVGVQVRALRRTWQAGRAKYTLGASGQTDDRGLYRISGLRPGEFVAVITQTPATVSPGAAAGPMDPAMIQAMVTGAGAGADPNALMAQIAAMSLGGNSGGIRVGNWVLQTSSFGSRLIPPTFANGRMFAYRTTFFPAASASSQAAAITLGSGEERAGVDFQLKPVAVVQISGTVVGPEGPVGSQPVRLLPAGADELSSDSGFESATTTTTAAGAFMFVGVPAGQYVLKTVKMPRPAAPAGAGPAAAALAAQSTAFQNAQGNRSVAMGPLTMDMMMPLPPPIPAEPTLWASVPLAVGETDIADLSVPLRTGFRVSGRAEFDGSATKPTPDQLRRMLISIDRADVGGQAANPLAGFGQAQGGQFDATGQFTTFGVLPGKYFVRVPFSFAGWTLKSATLGGRDVADVPLEIESGDISGVVLTFTDRSSEVSGAVRNAQGQAEGSASVVLFPVQPETWTDFGSSPRTLRVSKAGADGRYRLGGVPPGDYFVAAMRGDVANDWQNPQFLQGLSRTATRATVADGEKKALDLTAR